jgi:hypothetical protein
VSHFIRAYVVTIFGFWLLSAIILAHLGFNAFIAFVFGSILTSVSQVMISASMLEDME